MRRKRNLSMDGLYLRSPPVFERRWWPPFSEGHRTEWEQRYLGRAIVTAAAAAGAEPIEARPRDRLTAASTCGLAVSHVE